MTTKQGKGKPMTHLSLSVLEGLNALPRKPAASRFGLSRRNLAILLRLLIVGGIAATVLAVSFALRDPGACTPVTIGHSLVLGPTCR